MAPNADDLPTWTASMQHIAEEGRCFVVSVNSACKVSDFPSDYPPFTAEHADRRPDGGQWEADDIVNHGDSCIVGPLGNMVTEPVWDKEFDHLRRLEDDRYHGVEGMPSIKDRTLLLVSQSRGTAWTNIPESLTSTRSAATLGPMFCEWTRRIAASIVS